MSGRAAELADIVQEALLRPEWSPDHQESYAAFKAERDSTLAALSELAALARMGTAHEGKTPTNDRIREAHSAMQVEWLRGEHHDAYKQGHDERCYICALLAKAEAAEVENTRLRAALEPFAATSCAHHVTGGQDWEATQKRLDELREECRYCRARAALAADHSPSKENT